MGVGNGGDGAAGAVPGASPSSSLSSPSSPSRRTRREVTLGLLASGVALAAAPLVAASRPPRPASGSSGDPGGTAFEETYRGRLIRGAWAPGTGAAGTGQWQVTVDGHPLHLMRRADGTWLSMVDHYQSYPTPLEAARGAVDDMVPGQRLRDVAPGPVGDADVHPYPYSHTQGVLGGVHA